jgi:hypothetical protein
VDLLLGSRLPVAERTGSAGLPAGCSVDLPVHASFLSEAMESQAPKQDIDEIRHPAPSTHKMIWKPFEVHSPVCRSTGPDPHIRSSFAAVVAVNAWYGDFATTENLAWRYARLWGVISFQLSFRVTPAPNSEGPGPPAQPKFQPQLASKARCTFPDSARSNLVIPNESSPSRKLPHTKSSRDPPQSPSRKNSLDNNST